MSQGSEGEEPLWAPARENLIDLAGAALAVGVIAAGLSWLGAWYWRFELLANLRPPMALVLGLGALMFVALRAWRWAAVLAAGLLLAGIFRWRGLGVSAWTHGLAGFAAGLAMLTLPRGIAARAPRPQTSASKSSSTRSLKSTSVQIIHV